jgi:hypothetical protein
MAPESDRPPPDRPPPANARAESGDDRARPVADAGKRLDDASEQPGEEAYGPLALQRHVKDDGRGLVLYVSAGRQGT